VFISEPLRRSGFFLLTSPMKRNIITSMEHKYEKPQPRPYFYKCNGELKSYYYCSLCGVGPFKDEDFNDHKIVLCSNNGVENRQRVYYCRSCNSIIFPDKPISSIRSIKSSRPYPKQSKNHPFRRPFKIEDIL